MKVLQFLDQVSGGMAFGKAMKGTLFQDIYEAIGGKNTLGATLHRMRKKGFIESTGGLTRPGIGSLRLIAQWLMEPFRDIIVILP